MRDAKLAILTGVLVLSCSGPAPSNEWFTTGNGDADAPLADAGGVPISIDAAPPGDPGSPSPNAQCSGATQLVYVLSSDNKLYSFSPIDKKFTQIGVLGCPTTMIPNSMAIDRNAVAWVNYVQRDPVSGEVSQGAIFEVSTKDASCRASSIQLNADWFQIGMGFSTDTSGGASETLFVATISSGGGAPGAGNAMLGKVDFNHNAITEVGPFNGDLAGRNAELTGTGDARLFGFFTTSPVRIAEIDKSAGAIKSSTGLAGVETPLFWAFSFWGGDFYMYTAPDVFAAPERTTNVTRYRPSDKSIDAAYMTNIGFRIVGAGVSTCAPVAPPR